MRVGIPSTDPLLRVNIPTDYICELAEKLVVTVNTLGGIVYI